ncbi:MAG: glycosyltransferase family 2 protein [Proteobacteria bacterium]|nr:glycosyltransferase family 2 protein [Pseudomonadota bacterium]
MPFACVAVMPAYNESACLAGVIARWQAALQAELGDNYRLLVINDGSTDGTATVLDGLAGGTLLVSHRPNGGHGAAIRSGYAQALELGADYVFQTDSDDQMQPQDFARLWHRRQESRFILGRRRARQDAPHRRFMSATADACITLCFGLPMHDSNVPFRLMQAGLLRELLAELPPDVFAPNIFLSIAAARRGENLLHIPVTHLPRRTGKGSLAYGRLLAAGLRTLRELLRYRLRT